ncbi:MAG: serine/threonine protein kinase [Planctomycetota bacterium]|nr:serine/threonine protein kinase [Planctomycetota bacterium]
MKENFRSQLETLLTTEKAMLERWLKGQASNAEGVANDLLVRRAIYRLLDSDSTKQSSGGELDRQSIQSEVGKLIAPMSGSRGFVGFFVADQSKRIVASSHDSLVGRSDVRSYDGFLSRVLKGDSVVSAPFPSALAISDEQGELRTGVPTMWACVPIRDEGFRVVGALALQIRPEMEFTEILQLGRIGETGETYAFDHQGLMVSNSRFDEALILLGVLPDIPNSRSILNISLRDPLGDITLGHRPKQRRSELPLTKMAADAIKGNSGFDVEGYRDYRGAMVLGAWTWMPEYGMGLTTEIDRAEAYRPLTILQRTFAALYTLLIASSVAIFLFSLVVARMRREAQNAAIEAKQLGQYTLGEKLGAGAMGVVYKGQHAMLRRSTAIKLLDADKMNDVSIQRFEQEVQITCRLNHPSTIAIYDFGRTPEGVFYYAMEYLDGITLQDLVDTFGPQPEGRVISILLQVCGSLFEAHAQGLVHRDIKPANIMLSRRGGEPDVVKVLDFGLVKATDENSSVQSSLQAGMAGTPLYMSPEAIQSPMSVDGRSDLYALGAVGYFLLTGKPVFNASSLSELCQKHVDETPVPPSTQLGQPVVNGLEHALLCCLEKTRAKRPQTARDLAQLLKKCRDVEEWTVEDADAWWSRYERSPASTAVNARKSSDSKTQHDQTMELGS